MNKLYCHTTFIDEEGLTCAIEGLTYDIINEEIDRYEIISELGDEHILTKYLDDDGYSFASWFELVD